MASTAAHGHDSDRVVINVSGDEFQDEKGELQQLESDLQKMQSNAYASGMLKNLEC